MGRQVGRATGGPGPPLPPLGALTPLAQPQSSPLQAVTTTSMATTPNGTGPPSYPGPYEGLPAKFVQSMKTLFDILDEKGSGLVPLCDIESRWARQANIQVIDHLRAVADQNHSQLLSFDRFCLALKMSLLADSPKSSCSNSVSSVTSAGSPAPPVSAAGPASTTATGRGSLPQKNAAASGGPSSATITTNAYDGEFDHRRQESSSSTAGSLESSRFVSAIPPPVICTGSVVPTSSTGPTPPTMAQQTNGSRLPKFGSNNHSHGQHSTDTNKATADSGSMATRAASVPPTVSETFHRQENGSNTAGRLAAGTSLADSGKLNSSFENLFDVGPGGRSSATRESRVLPPANQQNHSHQTQRSMLPPPSLVRPPTVNSGNSSGGKAISRSGVAPPGAIRQPPLQQGQQQKPGPPPGPSPASANLRRIVRPPSGIAEPHRVPQSSTASTGSANATASTGSSGRSRTPDNFLENSSGHQRAIKPPMTRSVSSIAESQLQKQQSLHGPPDYGSQHSGVGGLAANRRPFPLPGLAAGPIPKAISSAGLQLGPPVAPPPTRRAHSVLHEIISPSNSTGQSQSQHHMQSSSTNSIHGHAQSLHNGANIPTSVHSRVGTVEHQHHQSASQQMSAASPGSLMANVNLPISNASRKLREAGDTNSHLPQTPGGAMLAPIQTEPVLTANKVMLGSGLNKVSSAKTSSQMRIPHGSSHYGHVQNQQQSPIGNTASGSASGGHSAGSGFLRGAVGQRDLSAMVRAIPCQPATASVQQVQPLKQSPSQSAQQPQSVQQQGQFPGQPPQPASTQQQTQFQGQSAQQVPLRQMCLPPGGPKPEKPPRRREPRRHTLAHGIEYGMIRRLKLLEEEREVLQKGLQAVERARDWYLRQVANVQDKLHATSHGHANPEYSIDTHEERLRLQMARIVDVNHRLAALVESGDKASFPLHMNLALLSINSFNHISYTQLQQQQHSARQQAANATEIKRLREHNAKLSSELENRQGVIKQLETEKAQLLRELFAAKAQQAQVQAQVQAHTQRFRGQPNSQPVPDNSLM